MKRHLRIIIVLTPLLFYSGHTLGQEQSAALKFTDSISAGMEFGTSLSVLFSGTEEQAFGTGFGSQYSVYATAYRDRRVGLKLRIDRVSAKQVSLQPNETNFLVAGTKLKATQQGWTLIGAGAEFRSSGFGQNLFLEALLGYAIGSSGSVDVQSTTTNVKTPVTVAVPLKSGLYIGGGAGFRKPFKEKFYLTGSVRTFAVFAPLYAGDFDGKFYYSVPFLFNLGVEYFF